MGKLLKYIIFLSVIFYLHEKNAVSQQQFTVEKQQFCSQEFDESSPAYYKNGIVFCSNKKNDFLISYRDTSEEGQRLYDLFFTSPKKDSKKWTSPIALSNGINTLFNEGPCCFYNDSANIAFSRNIFTDKKFGSSMKSGNYMGIFFADFSDDKWINVRPFEYNSTTYNVMHPSLTKDGKRMFFASDMPGGFGGFDIYVTNFSNGHWSKPVNLGKNVNTESNEAFPFIHSSGRLFFASKGWNSKGGFDIFFTQELENDWIQPQNMKEPFNSTSDDFGFIADESLQSGYFTSNRGHSDDIYSFKSIISEFDDCKPQQKNNFCYIFYENGTSEGDITGTMKYEWELGDGTKIRGLQAEHCFEKVGKYIVKLNVIDTLTGEVLMNQAQYEFEVEEIEQPIITAPEVAIAGEPISFDSKKSNLKNFRVAKYYWDFDDGLKGIGETVSHVFYQEGVYDVKLQLESVAGRNGVRKSCIYRSIAIKKK